MSKEKNQDNTAHNESEKCEDSQEFTTPCGKKVNMGCSNLMPCKFIGMGMSLFMVAMLFYILGRISADLFM